MGYIDFTNHFWQLYLIKKDAETFRICVFKTLSLHLIMHYEL